MDVSVLLMVKKISYYTLLKTDNI